MRGVAKERIDLKPLFLTYRIKTYKKIRQFYNTPLIPKVTLNSFKRKKIAVDKQWLNRFYFEWVSAWVCWFAYSKSCWLVEI